MTLPHDRQRLISYVLLSAVFFIGFFNRFAPATFARPIGQTFGLDAVQLGGLAAMHFWIYTVMQVPAGMLVDRFGIRWPATVGTLLTGAGALLLATAPSYGIALGGPFLVGIGMSVVFVSLMKNNALWFEGQTFARITGLTMLIAALGSIASESPTHRLLDFVGWRTIFGAVGLITLVLAGVTGWRWRPPPARPAAGTGARVERPSAWRAIFGNRQIWLVMLAVAGTNGPFYAFVGLWGTPLLHDGFGLNSTTASRIITLALIPYGLGSLLLGQLSDRLRTRKRFMVAGAFCSAAVWAWLVLAPWDGLATALACFFLLGLASTQVVVSFATIRKSVGDDITGSALALVNMEVFLTTAIVQTGYGVLLAASPVSAAHAEAFRQALWLPMGVGLIGFVATLGIQESFGR